MMYSRVSDQPPERLHFQFLRLRKVKKKLAGGLVAGVCNFPSHWRLGLRRKRRGHRLRRGMSSLTDWQSLNILAYKTEIGAEKRHSIETTVGPSSVCDHQPSVISKGGAVRPQNTG